MGVNAEGIPRVCQVELSNHRMLKIPAISFQQKLYSQKHSARSHVRHPKTYIRMDRG